MTSLRLTTVARLFIACLSVWTVAHPRSAAALSDPNDFCTEPPGSQTCTISSNKFIDDLATVDFGTRDVILQAELDVGTGSATVLAGSLSIPHPGKIRGIGTTTVYGGSLTIQTVNDISITSAANLGAVRMNGASGGNLTLVSTSGSITGSGKIFLDRKEDLGDGGSLFISAGVDVDLSGDISATGGIQGGGGYVDVIAGGLLPVVGIVRLLGTINVNGGAGGGGFVTIDAPGAITLGKLDADGGGDGGDGGELDVTGGGQITLTDRLNLRGGTNLGFCGDGGYVDLLADGDITIAHIINLNGPVPDCCGGSLAVDGANVRFEDSVSITGLGEYGCGGFFEVFATNSVTTTGAIDINGGDGGAGDLLVSADGDVSILGTIEVRSRNPLGPGPVGAEIDSAAGTLLIDANINADGGGQSFGGQVLLGGCNVIVNAGATVRAHGASGAIDILANDTMTLRGTFLVEPTAPNAGTIELSLGPDADPPDTAGATFNVTPSIVTNPFLGRCRPCITNEECADGNLCTDDICEEVLGCRNPPNTDPCDDGDACTLGDTCSASACQPGSPKNCDDGSSCTVDSCNSATGLCTNAPVGAGTPCDDGDACTQTDTCNAVGVCVGSNPVVCTALSQCHTPGVCDSGTGLCSPSLPKPADTPCDDTDACTQTDACDGAGSCVGSDPVVCTLLSDCHDVGTCNPATGVCSNPFQPPGTGCDDNDVCTSDDGCDGAGLCTGTPIPGCVDRDADGVRDDEDSCTALEWTPIPRLPPDETPNQHPSKFVMVLKKLSAIPGEQQLIAKGFFNPASSAVLPVDPATDGIHLHVEELGGLPTSTGGLLYELNIPGGSSHCDLRDGWRTIVRGTKTIWKYRNRTGALPPACTPGSANGILTFQLKDIRSSRKLSYQFIMKAKGTQLAMAPVTPITLLRTSLALGIQPSVGMASAQAMDGLCGESLFAGSPVGTKLPRPFCKVATKSGAPTTIVCRGR